ncbi:hypothetical protein TWF694_005287 [Orbilia ellipsospora]|uniref:Carboxylesterase type B domain-containing protein n=1 Tax=Orbilia ellipsospora TaxID=2528407 RepID=A0AAV9WSP1_9PEZI
MLANGAQITFTILGLLSWFTFAVPVPEPGIGSDINFVFDSELPLLKLPYATYRASSYDKLHDIYKFKNIRFAAPPTGENRWQKPSPPLQQSEVQTGDVGYICMQAVPEFLKLAYPILTIQAQSEDCLFLDVLVPGTVIRGQAKSLLPVVVWLYGGGYTAGSKDFFVYDGMPIVKSAQNAVIYVAPNYRLGAYGFLAGQTVEQQGGVPNAGFWDQRAAFQWIQDHIALVGGDKTAVTVMGESAGAGSITHHLIANGGTIDPLFTKAIIQSPAWLPQYDPGQLETQYASFEARAGCAGKGLPCLRNLPTEIIDTANRGVISSQPYGMFGFGPAIDSTFQDLPSSEFAKGRYWKNLEAVIVGHTAHEGVLFTPPSINSSNVRPLLQGIYFPNATSATIQKMMELYPEPGILQKYIINYTRAIDLVGQYVVNCNTRAIAEAYAGKSYTYRFGFATGMHSEDIPFTFFKTGGKLGPLELDLDLNGQNFATSWQSYLTSFIRSGNPNTLPTAGVLQPPAQWLIAKIDAKVTSLNVGFLKYEMQSNDDLDSARCDFWKSGVWTGRSG